MEIVFRTDASSQIGIGHVMRCLTLADALKARGANCRFICREHPGNLLQMIRQRGFEALGLPLPPQYVAMTDSTNEPLPAHASWLGSDWATDATQTHTALHDTQADWLIVDHYALDARWESALRRACCNLMVIDDLADRRHDCDLLVDPGLDIGLMRKYRALIPDRSILFLGPRYAILRPEFDAEKGSAANRQSLVIPRRLVVLFGGSDVGQFTLEALRAIRKAAPDEARVDVIVSVANQTAPAIKQFCDESPNFIMHVATDQIASLFASADLAVASGGGATYERLYLRLPSILKPVAENQRVPLEYMESIGLIDLYTDEAQLVQKLNAAFSNGVRMPPDVVENGVPAICDALLSRLVSLNSPVPNDIRRTFYWLQDDELRRQFLMSVRPERTAHFKHWRNLLGSDSQRVFSIYCGNEHVGNAGIKNIDHAVGEAELWLYIGKSDWKGQGVGGQVLTQLEHYIEHNLRCKKVVLHVSRDNIPAYSMYHKSGYGPCPEGLHLGAGFPPDRNILRMEKTL